MSLVNLKKLIACSYIIRQDTRPIRQTRMTGTLEKNPKAIIKVQLKYIVSVQDKSERHEIGKKTHCFLLKF